MPSPRRSRVFTISMPPEMATAAEALARKQSRTMSELFREAFRVYQQRQSPNFAEPGENTNVGKPEESSMERSIPRLLAAIRAEMKAESAPIASSSEDSSSTRLD